MRRLLILAALAMSLSGCDALDTLRNGLQHVKALSSSLKAAVGVEPEVSFDWYNGHLQHVTVTFPRVMPEMSLTELADRIRSAVMQEFEQSPDRIVMAFDVGRGVSTPSQK